MAGIIFLSIKQDYDPCPFLSQRQLWRGTQEKQLTLLSVGEKILLNKFWVALLILSLTPMGTSVVKNSNDDIMVMLQLLIYFSARVNKQAVVWKLSFSSRKYFQCLFNELESEPRAGKHSFQVWPHYVQSSTAYSPPPVPPVQTTQLICNFGKLPKAQANTSPKEILWMVARWPWRISLCVLLLSVPHALQSSRPVWAIIALHCPVPSLQYCYHLSWSLTLSLRPFK